MIDTVTLRLEDAKKTHLSGDSLASSLYTFPADILLSGALGAGKTTFVQGLAAGLGVKDPLTSPTYALEQRYTTADGLPFLHLDLYRLAPGQAAQFLEESSNHGGIRCVEWADRIEGFTPVDPFIAVHAEEDGDGRVLTIRFCDIPLPDAETIMMWRKNMLVPPHVTAHCRAVAELAEVFADHLIADGTAVRRLALERAAQVHDLMRFVDFREHMQPPQGVEFSSEQLARWKDIKQQYNDMRHEKACAHFLRAQGFEALARMVEPHGLGLPPGERTTIEQKILYYADKRVAEDRVVSIDERFADFRERYGNGKDGPDSQRWYEEALAAEATLFPDGPPA